MSAEQNKVVVRKFFEELVNKGDLDLINEIIAPNWVNIDARLSPLQGLEGAKKLVTTFRSSFSNIHAEILDMMAEGDRVAVAFTESGTQNGEFMGFPPSGKSIKATGIGIFRVANGKIIENRVNMDMLALLQQIGAVSAPQHQG